MFYKLNEELLSKNLMNDSLSEQIQEVFTKLDNWDGEYSHHKSLDGFFDIYQ